MAGDIVLQLRDNRYPGQLEMRHTAADEIERLRAALAEMTMAAGLMANVCFNAKQSHKVPEGFREALGRAQEGFDKARAAISPSNPQTPNEKALPRSGADNSGGRRGLVLCAR